MRDRDYNIEPIEYLEYLSSMHGKYQKIALCWQPSCHREVVILVNKQNYVAKLRWKIDIGRQTMYQRARGIWM